MRTLTVITLRIEIQPSSYLNRAYGKRRALRNAIEEAAEKLDWHPELKLLAPDRELAGELFISAVAGPTVQADLEF